MTAENNPRNLPDRIRRRLPHLPDITVEGIKETYDDMRSYTRRSIPLGLGGYSLYTALNNVLHDPKQAIAYGLAGTIIFTTDYKIAQREKWKQQEVYLGQARFWAKMEEEWKRNGETRFNQENHPPVTPIIEENSEEGYFMYDYLTDQAKVLQLLSETVRVIQSNPNMEESTKHYQDNINETCYSTRTSDRDNRFPYEKEHVSLYIRHVPKENLETYEVTYAREETTDNEWIERYKYVHWNIHTGLHSNQVHIFTMDSITVITNRGANSRGKKDEQRSKNRTPLAIEDVKSLVGDILTRIPTV